MTAISACGLKLLVHVYAALSMPEACAKGVTDRSVLTAPTNRNSPISAYVSICKHTSAYVSIRQPRRTETRLYQHTSADVSIRQQTSAYVSRRQHTSAYVSLDRPDEQKLTRQHHLLSRLHALRLLRTDSGEQIFFLWTEHACQQLVKHVSSQ